MEGQDARETPRGDQTARAAQAAGDEGAGSTVDPASIGARAEQEHKEPERGDKHAA